MTRSSLCSNMAIRRKTIIQTIYPKRYEIHLELREKEEEEEATKT